jgi:predicted permease
MLSMALFSVIFLAVMTGLIKLVSFLRQWPKANETGMMLSTVFMNAGNYGAPLIAFAFGDTAFAYSIVFMVIQTMLMNTVGVYIANSANMDAADAFRTVLRMPVFYALLAGILFQLTGIPIGATYYEALDMLASAAIPVVMIILGMQLARISVKRMDWKLVSAGTFLRLIFAPALAYVITLLLQTSDTLTTVLVVSTAMPSAATMAMISVQFDSNPQLVSSITLVTTLLSVPSLWVVLSIFQA